ncbi:uncharacterized protein [Ptychodera flava]|uniref:uncharacterized protein n=1 Tax=Ptychodera flava TaxID=63121 RepID=UPI00396A091C
MAATKQVNFQHAQEAVIINDAIDDVMAYNNDMDEDYDDIESAEEEDEDVFNSSVGGHGNLMFSIKDDFIDDMKIPLHQLDESFRESRPTSANVRRRESQGFAKGESESEGAVRFKHPSQSEEAENLRFYSGKRGDSANSVGSSTWKSRKKRGISGSGERDTRKPPLWDMERNLAEELNNLADVDDLEGEARLLTSLGRVYLERGKLTSDGGDFMKASALYNAALNRNKKLNNQSQVDSSIERIKDVETSLLKMLFGEVGSEMVCEYETDKGLKAMLDRMRKECTKELVEIDRNCDPEVTGGNADWAERISIKRAHAIRGLYHNFADRLKRFLGLLLDECGRALGDAPCSFAVVALGQLAREEITPYSPVQIGVLIDSEDETSENKEFAVSLLHLLQLKIIHMGETPVHRMMVKSLNDPTDNTSNWFYDSVTESGLEIRYDFPTVDSKPKRKDTNGSRSMLIMTPTEMATLVAEISNSDRGRCLAETLLASSYLSGDQTLVETYKSKLKAIVGGPRLKGMRQPTPGPRGIRFEQKTVGKDLAKKIAAPVLSTFCKRRVGHGPERNELDIKSDMCNFTSSVMAALTQFFSMSSQTPWDVIDEMQGRKVLDNEAANNLRVATSAAFELQMRMSLQERQPPKRPSSRYLKHIGKRPTTKANHRISDEVLFRFYFTMLPLSEVLVETVLYGDGIANDHMFSGKRFYDDSISNRLHVCFILQKHDKIEKILEGRIKDDASDHSAILDFVSETIQSTEFQANHIADGTIMDSRDESRSPAKIFEPPTSIPALQLQNIANVWRKREINDNHKPTVVRGSSLSPLEQLGEDAKTQEGLLELLSYTDKILKVHLAKRDEDFESSLPSHVTNSMASLGLCYYNLGKMQPALGWFGNALMIWKSDCGEKNACVDVAYVYDKIGLAYEAMEEKEKSLNYLNQALKMYHQIHGEDAKSPDIASVMTNIGNVYAASGDSSKKALAYHVLAMNMYRDIYGPNAAHLRTAASFNNAANAWNVAGYHRKAIHFHRKALEVKKKIYNGGLPHPDIASSLHNLGIALEAVGDLNCAFEHYSHSFDTKNMYYGSQTPHPHIAESLCNMGNVKAAMGENELATGYLSQAMTMYKMLYGEGASHPSIASCLNSMGNVHEFSGNYEIAISYYEQALLMKRECYKRHLSHPDIGVTLNNLGNAFDSISEYEKAIEHFLEALEVYRLSYGEESTHPDLATTYNNLGSTYTCLGEYRKAVSYYEQALRIRKRLYGDEAANADLALSNVNVGNMWDALGEHTMAIGFHDAALNVYKKVYRDEEVHPDIAAVLTNLGNSWGSLEDHHKAVSYHEMALNMYMQLAGDDDAKTDIANSLGNLGNDYASMDRYEKAIEYHMQALEIFRKCHQDESAHLDIASTLNNIGNAWDSYGDYEKAIEFHKQALELYKDIHGDIDHVDIASSLGNIGNVAEALGDNQSAIAYQERALQMYRNIYGEDTRHADIASALYNAGSAHDEAGDFRKALPYYEEALAMGREVFGEKTEHPLVLSALHSLGLVWENLGDHDKAKDFFEEAFVREDDGGDSSEGDTDSS